MFRKSWVIVRNQLTISFQIVANISKVVLSDIKLYFLKQFGFSFHSENNFGKNYMYIKKLQFGTIFFPYNLFVYGGENKCKQIEIHYLL